jgi:hypothetical protein
MVDRWALRRHYDWPKTWRIPRTAGHGWNEMALRPRIEPVPPPQQPRGFQKASSDCPWCQHCFVGSTPIERGLADPEGMGSFDCGSAALERVNDCHALVFVHGQHWPAPPSSKMARICSRLVDNVCHSGALRTDNGGSGRDCQVIDYSVTSAAQFPTKGAAGSFLLYGQGVF